MIYTVTLNPAVDRELTVPSLAYDTVLRATDWRVDYGGKGFNVSRMLVSLGTANCALAFAGGRAGELLHDGLQSLGIETEFIWVDGETRTNVSIVAADSSHYVKANEPGPTIPVAAQEQMLDRVKALARPGDWWVLAGSLPPGVSPAFYEQLIQLIQQAGAFAILDSSGKALQEGCQASPFLVKPNETEAAQMTGLPVSSTAEIAAAAQAIRRSGPANVVVSLGKSGAILAEGGQSWIAASPSIVERNPIGAGDSMTGGIVWALSRGLGLTEAFRWGIASGAATASQPGTVVGTRNQVESLVGQIEIEPLSID